MLNSDEEPSLLTLHPPPPSLFPKVHGYIQDSGHQRRDKHHEIYLSDMRRTAPERLKTILRQPMT